MSRPVIRVSADDFQNPPEIRWQLGKNSPEGFYRHAIDADAIREHLLEPLTGPHEFSYRTSTYDIRNKRPNPSTLHAADPASVVIVDGLFLFGAKLRSYWDYTIFVETPFETCIDRARLRNQEGFDGADDVETRYRERYIPGYKMYLDEVAPRDLANVVVEGDGAEAS